ncbi:MAG: hydrogenase maturation protease [Phycisphaerae bacterium]
MTTVLPKLLLGVGNVLRRDDGVGVHAVRRLAELRLGGLFQAYDAGLCGMEVAPMLERRDRLVVIDAIDAGARPGTIYLTKPEWLRPAVRTGVSLHDLHLLDALDEVRFLRRGPRHVRIVAVQVADVSPGVGLSPAVARAVPAVLRIALRELGAAPLLANPIAAASLAAEYGAPERDARLEGVAWN